MKILDKNRNNVLNPSIVVERTGRMLVPASGNYTTQSTPAPNIAYFVYLGRTTREITVKYVEFYCHTAGTTSQTAAEVGIFSTADIPSKASPTLLTKLYASQLLSANPTESLLTAGPKRNKDPMNTLTPAGTSLWAGVRINMSVTQPQLAGLGYDYGEGLILSASSASALTAQSTLQGPV